MIARNCLKKVAFKNLPLQSLPWQVFCDAQFANKHNYLFQNFWHKNRRIKYQNTQDSEKAVVSSICRHVRYVVRVRHSDVNVSVAPINATSVFMSLVFKQVSVKQHVSLVDSITPQRECLGGVNCVDLMDWQLILCLLHCIFYSSTIL